MYCTIEGMIYTKERLCNKFENVETNYIHKDLGVLFNKAALKNIKFREGLRGIKFSGSLAKYYFGNNLETLTIGQTKRAIEKLSDETHLGISGASISRVDFATNFKMNKPVQNYYSCLGSAPKLDRSIKYTSLYYINNSRALVFYDKHKEAIYRNTEIPNEYKNLNVLRYEYRHKKIYKEHLTGKKLYDPNIFNWLLDTWQEGYNSIKKKKKLTLINGGNKMLDLKTFKNNCTRDWIINKTGGLEEFFEMLDSAQREGILTKQNKSYAKKKLEEIFNSPELTKPNNLIDELDGKVKETADIFRS